jgi:glycosyltransferase involved in cell wall biosynthesis
MKKPKLIRITTVPISLNLLLTNQPRAASDAGFDVVLIAADGPEWPEIIARENCPYFICPMTRTISPLKDLVSLWKLFVFFLKEKPQIVHSHTPKAGLLSMIAGKIARVPVRIHTLAGLPLETATENKKKLLKFIEKITLFCSTETWPNSLSLLNFYKENVKNSPKLKLIGAGSSNGIDLSKFQKNKLDPEILAEIKNKIGFKSDTTYFLAVGRIVRDKGIPELIEAFCELKLKFSNIRLILVGSYENIRSEEILPENILKKIDDEPDIIPVGWSDKVEYYMALCNFLVFPSHREGFPNVLLQAGAMKLPVICSQINGNIDIVTDHETGLLHKPKDKNHLVEQLVFSLNHPEKMAKMAENLYLKVNEKFERNAFHKLIFAEYRRLLTDKNLKF